MLAWCARFSARAASRHQNRNIIDQRRSADASRPMLERLTLERLTLARLTRGLMRDGPTAAIALRAAASCYFPVIYRTRGGRISIRSRVPGERSETPISGLPEIGTHSLRKSAKADLR
jgi:hypothetical protein